MSLLAATVISVHQGRRQAVLGPPVERLRAAGVDVTTQVEGGQIHGFINSVGVSRPARSAVDRAISVLRSALDPDGA